MYSARHVRYMCRYTYVVVSLLLTTLGAVGAGSALLALQQLLASCTFVPGWLNKVPGFMLTVQ